MATLNGVEVSGTVARNERTPLFEEPEDGEKKRTRISARYSLDRWTVERDRERDDAKPDRGTGSARDRVTPIMAPSGTRAVMPKPERVHHFWTDAELMAIPRRGDWQIERLSSKDSDHRLVVARCTGPACGGRAVSRFEPCDWANSDGRRQACRLCIGHRTTQETIERRKQIAVRVHGKYEYVGVVSTPDGVKVRGRCTGGHCVGFTRDFQWSHWMSNKRDLQCNTCAQKSRLGQPPKRFTLAKLDAAAEEMRAQEERRSA